MKIGIIGSGISGLTCAHYLFPQYDITLFEAENYLGGHAHTVAIEDNAQTLWIDTGFIVCNNRNYPHFLNLLSTLKVPLEQSNMSFSVFIEKNGLVYNGSSLNGLFAQRKNLLNPRFQKMLYEIFKFNILAKKNLNLTTQEESLNAFLLKYKFSQQMIEYYLCPMISAIWSCDIEQALHMPLKFLLDFFNNHGLLDLFNRPQWYTIRGGSIEYVKKITTPFFHRVLKKTKIEKVFIDTGDVLVFSNTKTYRFDKVIIATHSDQAVQLIQSTLPETAKQIEKIHYQTSEVVLHTDTTVLPPVKRAWASWNYFLPKIPEAKPTVSYNMNLLQNLKTQKTFCVSLNLTSKIRQEHILHEFKYAHPLFDLQTEKIQNHIQMLNQKGPVYYCGAYCGNGFHEAGVLSALQVVDSIQKHAKTYEE